MLPENAGDWAAEFAESARFDLLPAGAKEHAAAVLAHFLEKSEELNEESARKVLLDEMPLLDLPLPARKLVPETIQTFLEWLQESGRTGEGYSLGKFVGALAGAFHGRLNPKGGLRVPPVVNRAPSIGRNAPCPCGSGKKFKKCCGRG